MAATEQARTAIVVLAFAICDVVILTKAFDDKAIAQAFVRWGLAGGLSSDWY